MDVRVTHQAVDTHSAVARELPVVEAAYTQLAPGAFNVRSTTLKVADVVLHRVRIDPLAAAVIVPAPSCLAFLLPLRWSGRYLYNGQEVEPSALYMCGGLSGYHTLGSNREGIAIGVSRSQFVKTAAAMQGIDPQEVRLPDGALRLGRSLAAYLREQLLVLLSMSQPAADASSLDGRPSAGFKQTIDSVYALILDACLQRSAVAAPAAAKRSQSARRIVCRAEECFVAAGERPVSMADLCQAAGVGRTALHDAFANLYGISPLAYFHKRRLMTARQHLSTAEAARGAVKRAALSAGLTALGRFSVEYQALFGESPSATLARATVGDKPEIATDINAPSRAVHGVDDHLDC